jgi:hypothetical protein
LKEYKHTQPRRTSIILCFVGLKLSVQNGFWATFFPSQFGALHLNDGQSLPADCFNLQLVASQSSSMQTNQNGSMTMPLAFGGLGPLLKVRIYTRSNFDGSRHLARAFAV